MKLPIYLREPTTYHVDWLERYEPNQTFYLTQSQREFLQNQGERHYQYDVAGTYARHIYNRLLIDLSYNSSRLEGNTYSLLETEKLVVKGHIQANKLNEEAVMILNHKEAIRYLVENAANLTIESQVICTLHYLLADGLLPAQECGLLRNHGVKIGGSTYLPLDNKSKLEISLSGICKKAARIQNPYEQSIFLLIHISYLQAFEDCNKRPMMNYIQEHSALLVPAADLEQFKTTILEDIHTLSISHIKGMGISPEDFYAWKHLKEQKN